MRISKKIILLIFMLLIILGVNTYFGIWQISELGYELNSVAKKDIVITNVVTEISEHQLNKSILFERSIRIAEELAFDETTAARKEHLLYVASLTNKGFLNTTQSSASVIIKGKELLKGAILKSLSEGERQELLKAEKYLLDIEKANIKVDKVMEEIFLKIETGQFELSIEDINVIQKDVNRLSSELKNLLTHVQGLTMNSLQKAQEIKSGSLKILKLSFIISIVLSIIVVISIIRSITQPLKNLVDATHRIVDGDFSKDIPIETHDEIGEVSQAFNSMTHRLSEMKGDLEQKNEMLSKSLELTNEQKKDLETINKELDRFVDTVSHDIRSPLMGITGYSSLLNSQYRDKLDDSGQKALDGIQKGGKRLNAMLNDLLSLTKISRIKNPYEQVVIKDLLDVVIERIEYRIKEHNVQLVVAENLPTIVCDRIKISEVFLNLINNAIKFSSKNEGQAPKVEVSYNNEDERYIFSVKDNGIGIDKQYHEQVFDIFRRLNDAAKYEGSGAGLSIVKEIIEEHGGKIWIESEREEGATFYFSIPKSLKIMEEA